MTTTSVSREGPVESAERSWSVRLLTKTEPGRRNRRTIDSVLLAGAALVVGLSAAIAAFAIAITQRLSTFYLPPIWGYASLRWLTRKGYV